MSDNLYLKAYREVFTKSGRSAIQTENVSLWQTPSAVTWDVLNYPTFEQQLEAYCKWAESVTKVDPIYLLEIYDTETRPKESYMNFDLENERARASGYETVWDDYEVVKVALVGTPEFEEVLTDCRDKQTLFPLSSSEYLGIGYRWVVQKPHPQLLRKEVQRLKAEEYEFKFSSI
jgi:hypothetical protein